MKKFLITALSCTLVVLLATFLVNAFVPGNASFDIQVHDTYFVFSYASILIPCLLMLTFIISLIASLLGKFANLLHKHLLIISGIGLVSAFIYFYSL